MTTEWLLRALAAGALLSIAGLAASAAAGWFRLPRRWLWASAMAGSLLLPALALAVPGALPRIGLPSWDAPVPAELVPAPSPIPSSTPAFPVRDRPTLAPSPAPRPLPRAVLLGWLAASLAMLAALAWSDERLHAIPLRRGPRVDGVPVLVAEHAGPMVLGVLRPRVVLPRWTVDEASPEERRLIVAHERAHIEGGDTWLLLLAALAVALTPWNPALWVQHRRLRLAVETDCDARVLAAGASRRLYLHVLLRAAGHPFSLSPLAPAWGRRGAHVRRRVTEMTSSPPAHRLLRAVPVAALALCAAAAACGVASRKPQAAVDRPPIPAGTRMVPSFGYTGMNSYYVPTSRRPFNPDGSRRLPLDTFPVVTGIDRGSPAHRAGLRPGDMILAVDGFDAREDMRWWEPPRPGERRTYLVRRGGFDFPVEVVADTPQAVVARPGTPWGDGWRETTPEQLPMPSEPPAILDRRRPLANSAWLRGGRP